MFQIGADDPVSCHAVHVHIAWIAPIREAPARGKVVPLASTNAGHNKSAKALLFKAVSNDLDQLAHLSPFRQALPGSLKTPMPAASACVVPMSGGVAAGLTVRSSGRRAPLDIFLFHTLLQLLIVDKEVIDSAKPMAVSADVSAVFRPIGAGSRL